MRKHGPRFDPDGVVQHAPVANTATYEVQTILWRRRIAGGTIRCELLRRQEGPGHRIVQLVADYGEGDTACTRIRRCESPEEELEGGAYLERVIIEASRRGVSAERAPAAPAPFAP